MKKLKSLKMILKIILKEDVNTIMQGIKKTTRLNVKCNPVSQSSDKQTSRQKFGLFWFGFLFYI